MTEDQKSAIIISASSDIGIAMCQRWLDAGWRVHGTYRTESAGTKDLAARGMHLVSCDLSDLTSIRAACDDLSAACSSWDVLILCPGTQIPVGEFLACDVDEWEESVGVNFARQLRIIHALLPFRNRHSHQGPCVLTFAGGGTNNATVRYSAYTISKIALIKMTELLDAEIPDTRFATVGPGWVKTKIHDATLEAGTSAGDNYEKTRTKLASDELTPMEDVLDCCDWIIRAPRDVVSGRNFSVVFDQWGTESLSAALKNDPDIYKLRRCGNDILMKGQGESS